MFDSEVFCAVTPNKIDISDFMEKNENHDFKQLAGPFGLEVELSMLLKCNAASKSFALRSSKANN